MGSGISLLRPEGFNALYDIQQHTEDRDLVAYIGGFNANTKALYNITPDTSSATDGTARLQAVNSDVSNIGANVMAAKQANFTSNFQEATQVNDNLISSANALYRTYDVMNVSDELQTDVSSAANSKMSQRDLADRQYELNQWANSDKLDTLYFLQILFICLTFITLLVYLKSIGIVTPSLFVLFSTIAGIIAILLLVLRSRYTRVIRDPRYWHKVKFPTIPNDVSGGLGTTCT